MNNELLTDEEFRKYFFKYKQGDLLARDIIIEKNIRLVTSIAKKYVSDTIMSFDDLCQEGSIGLLKAIDKFDIEKGFKFSTYATWWIRQSIQRALADNNRSIRLPVHVQESIQRIKKAQSILEQTLDRDATIEEIADTININCDFYDKILKHEDFKKLQESILNKELNNETEDILLSISEYFEYEPDVELILKDIVNSLNKKGIVPSLKAVKKRLNLTTDKIKQYLKLTNNVSSLDVAVNDDMAGTIADTIADKETVETIIERNYLIDGIEKAINECFKEEDEEVDIEGVRLIENNIKLFEELNTKNLKLTAEKIENIDTIFPNIDISTKKELVRILRYKTKLKKTDFDEVDINVDEFIIDLNNMLKNKTKPKIDRAELIKRRFGVCGYNKKTLEELGIYYNLSRERIRQIEKKILKDEKFKAKLLEYCNIDLECFASYLDKMEN